MKTKKLKPTAPKADLDTPMPSTPHSEDAPESDRDKPGRVSFNVTFDGIPDWDRMQAKTKHQLSELLRNKAVQKELGISPEEVSKIEKETQFEDAEANMLLDLLSGIDSMAASKIYSVPSEVTRIAFAFTPDHRKKINPALTKVLNKWSPVLLKTWKDEIGVAIVMLSVLNAQVQLMHILEERRKKGLGPKIVAPISTAQSAPEPVRVMAEQETPKAVAPESVPVVQSKEDDLLENVGFNL